MKPNLKNEDILKLIQEAIKTEWRGLRPELVIYPGTSDNPDKKIWILEDPVQGNYYEIGNEEAQFILCLISESDIMAAVYKLRKSFSINPSLGDVIKFLRMLVNERLAITAPNEEVDEEKRKTEKKQSIFKKIFTGYLFFKIPIIRPDDFLNLMLPWIKFLWSRSFLFLYAVLSGIGILALFQQWELYWHTANHLFTPRGFFYFFIALSVVKTLHEFGHTFAAKANGLFVRRMGMAFMVFMPVLYCDISDAWRCDSRKRRLIIASAGILTEFIIAGIALFIWSVSGDGIIKSIMFYISGASLVSSILTNMNPLMRFDAYYLLMDYLKINNLRVRSINLYKYFLRRILVDWKAPIPEVHPKNNILVGFGFASSIYRIFIFVGIAFAIYHFVFKALGIILVLIEIILLVILPLFIEIRFLIRNKKYWGERKKLIRSALIGAFIFYMIIFPVPNREKLPGFFMFEKVVNVKSPASGEIVTDMPKIKTRVAKGDILLKIENSDIENQKETASYNLDQLNKSIERLSGGGIEGGYRNSLLSERKHFEASLKTAEESAAKLDITVPFSCFLAGINETLQKGVYIAEDTYLFTAADTSSYEIVAYADENIRTRLKKRPILKGKAVFKNLETASFEIELDSIRDFPAESFPAGANFHIQEGRMGSIMGKAGNLNQKTVYYPIIFNPVETGDISSLKHGTECEVIIKSRKSAAASLLRWAFKGLAKEGFLTF